MAIESGKYISKELSDYIYQWVDQTEIKELADEHNISYETGRAISSRIRKVTDKNKDLIIDIVKRAIRNRNRKWPQLEKAHYQILEDIHA